MSITVERLEAHVEVTGVAQAERELTSFKAKTTSILKGTGGDAKVKLLLDSTNFKAQVKKAIAEAQAEAGSVRISTEVDGFARELNEKISRAQILADAKSVKIRTDVGGVGGGSGGGGSSHQNDKESASADKASHSTLKLAGAFGALKAVMGGLKISAIATGLGAAASAIGSLAAGATAAVGPLSSLAGVLGVIPGLGIAMGSAFLVGKLALGGVIKGIQEQEAASKAASGQQDKEASKARSRAAQARSNADSLRSANDGIAQSEHSLMLAQEAAGDAQKNLIDTRREAARHLVDIRIQTRQLALDEEGAVNNLADARQRLNDLMKPPTTGKNWKFNEGFVTSDQNASIAAQSTMETEKQKKLAIRDATLAIKNAELSLMRTRIDQQRQLEDGNRDLAKGVELSDAMISAKRQERDARYGVAQAVKGEVDARRNLVETNLNIRDSVAAMAEADAADAKSKKDQLTEYNKLSQTGKDFVDFYRSVLKPALDGMKKAAGDALLPGLKSGAVAALPFLKTFRDSIARIGDAMGGIADKFGHLFGSDQFRSGMGALLADGATLITKLGTAAVFIANALKNVALIARPLTQWLGDMAVKWGEAIDRWSSDKNGKLADFFDRARVNAEKVFAIAGSLYTAIKNVVAAARPLGDWIMDALVRVTDKFKVWSEAASSQKKMAGYFNDQKGPLKEIAGLVGDVAKAVFDLSNNGMATGLFAQIRKELVPALKTMASTFMSEGFGKQLISTVTSVVKLLTQLGGASGGLIMTLKFLGGVADGLSRLTKEHPTLKKVVLTIITLGYALKALNITGMAQSMAQFATSFKMMKLLEGMAGGEETIGSFTKLTGAIGGATTGIGLAAIAATALIAVGLGKSMLTWKDSFHQTIGEIQKTEASMQALAGAGETVKAGKVADNLREQIRDARVFLDNESKKPIWEQAWNRILHPKERGKNEALAGAKDQVEDLAYAVEAKSKVIHDGMAIMAGSLGITRGELKALIDKYNLGPTISKGNWKGAYDVLTSHRNKWANIVTEIDAAKTAMDRYWAKWDARHGGTSLTSQAALGDSQREMTGMDINPGMLTNGKFDPSKEGASALLENIKNQRQQAFAAAAAGVADGSKTKDEAKAEVVAFQQNLEKVLAVRLGSAEAAHSLMYRSGLGADSIAKELALLDKAIAKSNSGIKSQAITTSNTWKDATNLLSESLAHNGKTLDENTEAGRTNAAAMKNLVTTAYVEANAAAWSTSKGVGEYKEKLVASTSALLDQIAPWFKNRDAAGEYLAKVTGIPKDVITKAVADTGQAQANIDNLKAAIDRVNGALIIVADAAKNTFNNLFNGWGGADGNILTPNAMGGFYDKPTRALIGEDGPEVVLPLTKPNQMKMLISNPKVKAALKSVLADAGASVHALTKDEKAMHLARESIYRATEAHRKQGPAALNQWNDALGRFFYQGPVPVEPIYPNRLTPENTAAQLAQVQADADKAMAGRQHALDQHRKAEEVHQHNTFHNQVNPQITARELARGLKR